MNMKDGTLYVIGYGDGECSHDIFYSLDKKKIDEWMEKLEPLKCNELCCFYPPDVRAIPLDQMDDRTFVWKISFDMNKNLLNTEIDNWDTEDYDNVYIDKISEEIVVRINFLTNDKSTAISKAIDMVNQSNIEDIS